MMGIRVIWDSSRENGPLDIIKNWPYVYKMQVLDGIK